MTELTKTWKDRIQELDGFDWCILPFIYLEAFVVNILHNANIEVPDRVSLRKEDNTPIPPVTSSLSPNQANLAMWENTEASHCQSSQQNSPTKCYF